MANKTSSDNSNPKNLRVVNAAFVAMCGVFIFIVAITIVAELNTDLKSWLAESFSHHWIGKGVLAVLLYVLLMLLAYAGIAKPKLKMLENWIWLSFFVGLTSAVAIAGFYLLEMFLV